MELPLSKVFKNQKVLVTGHTGFKGSWLCLLLNKLGAKVYGFALSPPTSPSLYEEAKISKHVNSYTGNISDFIRLKNVIAEIEPIAIIHMAAQALVRQSYADPIETYATNVMGTVNLLTAIRETKSVKALINVTTDKCYENKEWAWGYREIDRLGGYDPYSNSKACSELVTLSFKNSFFNEDLFHKHGVAIATARAGNVIGGGDWAKDRLIPDLIKAIEKGEKIVIRKPRAIRPWQHVLDALMGYLYLLEKLLTEGPKYGGAWNFGPNDSEAKNVEWITSTICELWGTEVSYDIDTAPMLHEATYLKLDCSKARAKLNWNTNWNVKTSIESIVDWHKAHQKGADMNSVCTKQIDDYLQSQQH